MAKCEICGSTCAEPIAVRFNDVTHTFDSLECAIVGLAPRCANCGELVVSHGVNRNGQLYCEGCAEMSPFVTDSIRLRMSTAHRVQVVRTGIERTKLQ